MLTVIFSTFNGADTLPMMLTSLTQCVSPAGGWKLIAVDNGSTDDSFSILETFLASLPLSIVTEKRQGKNFALNTAIDVAVGDVCVFTDDDVIVDPLWLVNYRHQVDKLPEIDIFSGVVLPHWVKKPPLWVLDWVDCANVFALTPSWVKEGEILPGLVFGPNMAIRKSIFDQGYRYDTNIGPNGRESYIMGSETSFTTLLASHGTKIHYLPDIKVAHIIQPYQLEENWILSRAIRAGRGLFHEKYKKGEHQLWYYVPRYFIRLYLMHLLRYSYFSIVRDLKNIFNEKWNINFTKGLILESYNYYK